jgi:hypothetical protein
MVGDTGDRSLGQINQQDFDFLAPRPVQSETQVMFHRSHPSALAALPSARRGSSPGCQPERYQCIARRPRQSRFALLEVRIDAVHKHDRQRSSVAIQAVRMQLDLAPEQHQLAQMLLGPLAECLQALLRRRSIRFPWAREFERFSHCLSMRSLAVAVRLDLSCHI